MAAGLPDIWEVNEATLDKHFIGQWQVTPLDDYKTPKAGKTAISATVRSKIDRDAGIVRMFSYIPQRHGITQIEMNGSIGICGKVTERMKTSETGFARVDFLFLRAIPAEDIIHSLIPIDVPEEGDWFMLKGKAEIDDVVFNIRGEFTFDITYFVKDKRSPVLWGMVIDIPLAKYNHYIRMRDLWYRDYEGATVVGSPVSQV